MGVTTDYGELVYLDFRIKVQDWGISFTFHIDMSLEEDRISRP